MDHMSGDVALAEAIKARHLRGLLTARERIDVLFDDSFIEATAPEGAGVVTGRGTVNGRRVMVFAIDILASGSLTPAGAARIVALQRDALEAGAPIVGLFDEAPARAGDGLAALGGFGEILRASAELSGIVPQIAVVMGGIEGAMAFVPAMSDLVFMIRETSHVAVAGPDIVGPLTGESVDAQALGGAAVHGEVTGLADAVFDDEVAGLLQMRRLIDFLPASAADDVPHWPSFDTAGREEPSLGTLVPEDEGETYDIGELIAKTLDEGDFLELKASFARNIVTGLGRFDGRSVGVVASQPLEMAGVIDADAARKAADFVRFCDGFGIPLVTLIDTPGFLPGTTQEHRGLARAGAELLAAYARAMVPHVSVITRNAIGSAGLIGSRALGADAVFAWENARIALSGPGGDRADGGLETALAGGHIDAVIAPRETRARIIRALAAKCPV